MVFYADINLLRHEINGMLPDVQKYDMWLTDPGTQQQPLLKTTIVKKLLNNDQCTHFTK